MTFIARAWTGGERLWLVFWLYLVAGTAGLTALGNAVWSYWKVGGTTVSIALLVMSPFVTLGYIAWISVSLWRCAPNTNWRGWTRVVRGGLVAYLAANALFVAYVFAHKHELAAPEQLAARIREGKVDVTLLKRRDLKGADLRSAKLARANLYNAELQGADLKRSDLTSANLEYAFLMQGDLQGATMRHTNLKNARLSGANLRNAQLAAANLESAQLDNADLDGASLPRASLRYANLSHASFVACDLSGADLRNAKVDGANFSAAVIDGTTRLPAGFDSTHAGMVLDRRQPAASSTSNSRPEVVSQDGGG